MFRFSSYTSADDYRQYLMSPELDATGAVHVEFEYRAHNQYTEEFMVGYSETPDFDDFVWVDEVSTSGAIWNTFSGTYPAGTKYVAVLYTSQYQYYLYVDNFVFAEDGFAQVTDLVEGWNWFSAYIAIDDPEEGLIKIEEALGEYGMQIKYLEDFTDFDGEEWFGGLEEATNDLMYMIQVSGDVTVFIPGEPVETETVEIMIEPGWNWIGFPSEDVIAIEDALADFDAADGDAIKYLNDFTDFDGDEWFGDLEELTPGLGYMYYNNTDETKIMVISTAKKARTNK